MHDGTKIAMFAGALGAVVGLALQTSGDQLTQTIGQGWMLGGVASTALMGGVAAISAKWQSFKAERQMSQTIEHLETAVEKGVHTDGTTLKSFIGLARESGEFFEYKSDSKKEAVAQRLQILGMSIADKMPHMEQADSAANVVHNTMGSIRFKLGVSLNQDAPVRKAGIDIDITSPSAPSMG